MSNNKSKHIHKYRKENLSEDKSKEYLVYKCTKPICTHYINIKLAEGKICECNICGEPMIITRAILIGSGGRPMAKPHCPNCTKSVKKNDVEFINQYLSKLGE